MATTRSSANGDIDALSAVLGTDASAYLDPAVATAWIALLTAYGRVTRALSAELMDASGMSLADFDVLAQLVRSEGHALRMSELADAVRAELFAVDAPFIDYGTSIAFQSRVRVVVDRS